MSDTPLVCLDIDGTLTDGVAGPPLPGAIATVRLLRSHLPVRLVTNTTSRTHATLAAHLLALGLLDRPEALITPIKVAEQVLVARGQATGVLLADEVARQDFAWFREEAQGQTVVLATEGHHLRIAELQPAFRRLLAGAAFYTVQRNRYFARGGELVTDVGPLAAFLSYASGRDPVTLGKPSVALFDALAEAAGITRQQIVMVGDDVEFDAAQSVAIGMRGVLVKTGKYRPGDEQRVSPPPTITLDSIADLPAWLGLR
jgi:HAD superfamily hydrolase (TIGR01458 family)